MLDLRELYMPQKMFRLSDSEVEKLKSEARRRGCTQTDVIRSCIAQLGEDTRCEDGGGATGVVLDALVRQLDAKDAQLADMGAALVAAQETARAAQALHAADKPELRLEAAEHRKSRWARLRDAWRG